MTQPLRCDVSEYVPSWLRKEPGVKAPAREAGGRTPSATPSSVFTTSVTATNTVTTHSGFAGLNAAPYVPTHFQQQQRQPQQATGSAAVRSPTTMHQLPTRMSPVHPPMPSMASKMSPSAANYVPRSTGTNSLAPLPTSTADLAVENEWKQRKQIDSPSAEAWLRACSKSNGSQPAGSPVHRGVGMTSPTLPIHVDKTEQEVLEISKQSSLKVSAAPFVPRRTLNRLSIVKPSPFTLTPASGEMRLADPWCLFYLPVGGGENVRDVTYDPTLVFRVDSISSFWRVFNNVPEPKDMGIGTLYLFRDGINPKWEDPRNRDGGVVRVKLDATTIGEAWTVLLCRTVGESWSKSVRNVVNGVALKVRERAFILEVWVTENTAELISDISELLHQFLGGAFPLSYTLHSVAQERAAAAALAEKEKKKNKINARHW